MLTDYLMPRMTGLQLAQELARPRPGLAVLLATGDDDLREATASRPARLGKPFRLGVLAQAIDDCFAREGNAGGAEMILFTQR